MMLRLRWYKYGKVFGLCRPYKPFPKWDMTYTALILCVWNIRIFTDFPVNGTQIFH